MSAAIRRPVRPFGLFKKILRQFFYKAHELHRLPDDEWDERIESYDQEVAQFASVLCSPFRIINVLTETINDSETKEPYQIIEELRQ